MKNFPFITTVRFEVFRNIGQLKTGKTLNILALITIIYWASLLIYLPPIRKLPDFNKLVSDLHDSETSELIKDIAPEYYTPKDKLIADLNSAYLKTLIIQYTMITLGLLSGILIFFHRRIGKHIALVVCLFYLFFKFYSFLIHFPNILDPIVAYLTLFLPSFPLIAIHEICGMILAITTIYLLSKRKTSLQFERII